MAEMIQPAMVPKVKLYTGEEIPCVGMGTFGSDRFTPEQVSNAVAGAIRCGYRMFDCAACYGNEDQIGEVFHAAFEAVSYTHLRSVQLMDFMRELQCWIKKGFQIVKRLFLYHWYFTVQVDSAKKMW